MRNRREIAIGNNIAIDVFTPPLRVLDRINS